MPVFRQAHISMAFLPFIQMANRQRQGLIKFTLLAELAKFMALFAMQLQI
jgi:hypothetical protein